jgi:uncharacterized OsmC-like protein
MKEPADIKRAFERNARAMELRPAVAQATGKTTVRIREGLTCEIEDGPWKLVADMPESCAGGNEGPDSGPLGRGALGACLAIGYTMWAAKLEVPIKGIEVEIAADYDVRGFYGVADVPPGYLEVRYTVRIESDAPEEDIIRVLDTADNHSPWHHVFSTPQKLKREIVINP